MEHVENLLKTTLGEIERLLNTRTVVGERIKVEGTTWNWWKGRPWRIGSRKASRDHRRQELV